MYSQGFFSSRAVKGAAHSLVVALSCCTGPAATEGPLDGIDLALGVHRLSALSVDAIGTRYEPWQTHRPGDPAVLTSTFHLSATFDVFGDRLRLDWSRERLDPSIDQFVYSETLEGDSGYVEGNDLVLGFGNSRPMSPDRVAAVRRQQFLLHPHLLVRDAFAGQHRVRYDGVEYLDGARHHVLEIAVNPQPVRLFISARSHRISRLQTAENDFPRGDVAVRVDFFGWKRIAPGVWYPHRAEVRIDGVLIHEETRTRVVVHSVVDDMLFTIPEVLPPDPERMQAGLASEQWINRSLALAVPTALGPSDVVATEIAPGVVHLTGSTHHSLAIARRSDLVIVEPPLHEARSLSVIAKVRELWPDKPIRHVVLTHFHHDHSGGVRAYAALGANLIVAEGDRAYVEEAIARPHLVQPDSLARSPRASYSISAVAEDPWLLCDGGIPLEVHRIPSVHCAENLIVYLPDHRILFNSDIYSPGFLPPDLPLPAPFDAYAVDLLKAIDNLKLQVEHLTGGHGAPGTRPYSDLVAHAMGVTDLASP